MAKSKFIPIDDARFEKQHLSRVEKYAAKVEAIYKSALDEYARLGASIGNVNLDKLFSFKDYPETKKKVDKIINDTYGNVLVTIKSGIENEWKFAGDKNDALVKSIQQKSKLSKAQISKYSNRNIDALTAFQNRKDGPDRLGLSDRVWKYVNDQKNEVELGLDIGIGEGKSAAAIASLLKKHLKDPSNLFRKVRDKRRDLGAAVNIQRLSKAAENYNPGTGVYRSSYKNAMRVARTETNMAYRAADYERWQQLDFVVGIEIRLSNNPNHCKLCETLAGKYPKEFKFLGWHPQCRCHAVSIRKTREEFERDQIAKLNGGNSGNSENSVSDVPDKFKEWVDINKDRDGHGKNKPFWVKDNFKDGELKKGLKFKTKPEKPVNRPEQDDDDNDIIDLNKYIAGKVPTDVEVNDIMMAYAAKNPDDFRTGLERVSFTKGKDYLMEHSAMYSPLTSQWTSKTSIKINNRMFDGIDFNPAIEFKNALGKIKAGTALSFNEEYAMESMWHEILHAKSKTPPRRLTTAQTESMETVNQFVARHTYPDFISKLGGQASNQEDIMENGYGYASWIRNFRNRLRRNGISEELALKELMPVLMKDYRSIEFELLKFFAKYMK